MYDKKRENRENREIREIRKEIESCKKKIEEVEQKLYKIQSRCLEAMRAENAPTGEDMDLLNRYLTRIMELRENIRSLDMELEGKRKLKIAMIGHKRFPSREGGIEVVVSELAPRMAALGHEVHLYDRLDDYSLENIKNLRKEYQGVRIHQVPTFKPVALNAFVYSVLATLAALSGHYDVIHFHAEGPSAMTFLTKRFHIPSVVTIHGLDWQRAKWDEFATDYLLFAEKTAAKYADEMIVLSRGVQNYFMDTYDRQTNYISNGIDLRPSVPAEQIRERWGLEKDSYLLYLGRLVPEKGIHYLIEAYKEIKTTKRLVIAGKITGSDYSKEICRLAAEDDRIIMTDFVEGQTLEELFSNTFLYVLPSDIEGMPMSLLEAMSYGARCLISGIQENTETAGEHADVFEKGNVAILREKIRSILAAEGKFSPAAQIQFVKQNYSWDRVVKETLRVYINAIDEKQGGRAR